MGYVLKPHPQPSPMLHIFGGAAISADGFVTTKVTNQQNKTNTKRATLQQRLVADHKIAVYSI